jgi:hypothetical protein
MQSYLEFSAIQISHKESFNFIICPMRSTCTALFSLLLLMALTSMGKCEYCGHVQMSSSKRKKDKGALEYIAQLDFLKNNKNNEN